MQLLRAILTPLVAAAVLATAAPLVQAQNRGDDTLLEMHQAFRKGDRKKLEQLLPAARGHALEPWAAYWELKLRLGEASPAEIQAFLKRYAGTYQEDRLRNDWLLLLGQRRDWSQFAEQHPSYRMSDDKEVRCYALLIETLKGTAPATAADEVRRNWYAQRDSDDGCTHAAGELYSYKQLTAHDVWRKARLAVEANRVRSARAAVEIVSPESSAQVKELMDSPTKYLQARATARGKVRQELVTLALIKLAQGDADNAATQLDNKWSVHLSPEERNWVWGVIGKQAAQRLSSDAVTYFGNVTKDSDLTDDLLGWKARAALRAGQWKVVRKAVEAMGDEARRDSTWVYWHAKAVLNGKPSDAERAEARQALLREGRDRAQLPSLNEGQRRDRVQDHERNMPRDDVLDGRPAALVLRSLHVQPFPSQEELSGQVVRGASPWRRIFELPRLALRQVDERAVIPGGKSRVGHEQQRDLRHQGDVVEVLLHVVRNLRKQCRVVDKRSVARGEHRVAVLGRVLQLLGGDHRRRTGLVDHDHRLLHVDGHGLGNDTREGVRPSAGRRPDDPGDGTGGETGSVLSRRRRRKKSHGQGCEKDLRQKRFHHGVSP